MKGLTLVLVSCAMLGACSNEQGSKTTEADSTVLYVYNWNDYIAEDTVTEFTKETGIKVVYDVYDSNETLEAKLLSGASGYDLVFPSARPFAEKQLAAGVYANLDKSVLSNWSNLDTDVLKSLNAIDTGNAKLVPYLWGTTGIGYNVKKVREILGPNTAIDSWSLIFDPAIAGKLAQCGIALLDDPEDVMTSALLWKGLDPKISDPKSLAVAKQILLGTRANIKYFQSSQYITDLANGDICVAMGYSGDVFQARDRAHEAANGVDIAFVIPKEGAVRWVDTMAIPDDAHNKANAMQFINYLLRPQVAANISNHVSYATPNLAARALLDPELAADQSVYPSPEVSAKLIDAPSFPADIQRERVRLWSTIKTGK